MAKVYDKTARGLQTALALAACLVWAPQARAHGFNANRVNIVRMLDRGVYRVIISYTHVGIAEYREAHIDFRSRDEALRVYRDLARGADFFLGDVKGSIHFHPEPERNQPY